MKNWSRQTKVLGYMALVMVSLAWASTKVRDAVIVNSTIDSTPIGFNSASSARFTYMAIGLTGPNPLPSQGGFEYWNLSNGGGETDFINDRGAGPGGFRWFDVPDNTTVNASSPILSLTSGGTLSANAFAGPLTGNVTGNVSGNVTGNVTGNVSGNAGSANQLNTALNCASTTPATGIQLNGNANCGSYPNSLGSTGYTTLPGGLIMQWGSTGTFDTGPVSIGFSTTFPHACLQATASDSDTAGRIVSMVGCTQTSISIKNNGSGTATFWAIGY